MTLPLFADIIATFRKARGGPPSTDPAFWKAMALAGGKEVADAEGGHLLKELADLTFISVDGIAALGSDPEAVIRARLRENGKKNLKARDADFYRKKARLTVAGNVSVGSVISMEVSVHPDRGILIGNGDFGILINRQEARQLAALLRKAVRP